MKFCERPFNSIYLPPSGEVWPCAWMHFVMGNLNDQSLEDIWNSDAAKAARETILDGSFAFCRKTSCQFIERGTLPDLSEEEIKERAVAAESPEFITVANDKICNIACTTCRTSLFCPEEGYREKLDVMLDRLLPALNRAKHVDLNGYGEFLANPSFVRLLEKLRPERDDFQVTFETNGILFDEEHWAKFSHLQDYRLNVVVTINSLRRENYRYLTGGFDKLEQALNNLKFLSELRRENKINWLMVTMVIQESNFWEIPEYVHTFAHSGEYEVDQIVLKPVYNWYGMAHDTYWFKNILNPLHPYHKAYLKILEDDCWKEPKVLDWGCHNIRESRLHPLSHEQINNRLLLRIYENGKGMSPADYLGAAVKRICGGRVGVYGDDEFSQAMLRLLQKTDVEIAFRLTRFKDEEGEIPTISLQNLQPDMADAILMLDSYDQAHWTDNLRNRKFQGPIVNLEELLDEDKEDSR